MCILLSTFSLLYNGSIDDNGDTNDSSMVVQDFDWYGELVKGGKDETFFKYLFTVEVVLRFLSAEALFTEPAPKEKSADKEKKEGKDDTESPYFLDPFNWVDIISVLPSYIEGDQSVAVLKGARVLRVFKICRRFDGTEVIVETARRTVQPLLLPVFFFFMFSFVLGALIWSLEPCYDYTNETLTCQFPSVYAGLYFTVVTMTTVGYGDQVPTFGETKFIAIFIMIFGSLFLSMPLSVIGTEFELVWAEHKQRQLDKKKEAEAEIKHGSSLLEKMKAKRQAKQAEATAGQKKSNKFLSALKGGAPGSPSKGGFGSSFMRSSKTSSSSPPAASSPLSASSASAGGA